MADKPKDTDDTKLTAEQRDRIVQKIFDLWRGNRRCPVCESQDWYLSEHLVTPVRLNQLTGTTELGDGDIYPQAMMVCLTCGYTRYFNMVILGFYASDSDSSSDKADGG